MSKTPTAARPVELYYPSYLPDPNETPLRRLRGMFGPEGDYIAAALARPAPHAEGCGHRRRGITRLRGDQAPDASTSLSAASSSSICLTCTESSTPSLRMSSSAASRCLFFALGVLRPSTLSRTAVTSIRAASTRRRCLT